MTRDAAGSFAGKVALITGAAGDVGAAAVRLFAGQGAAVVAVDRNAQGLDSLRAAMPGDAALLTVVSNVTDEDQVEQYVRQALDTFGRIDCFFNNAGIEGSRTGAWSLIPDLSVEDFNEILSVNCTGVFLGLKHVIPALLLSGGGAVVNTSSINGLKGAWGQVAYTASKHAVSAMTAVAAKEWGRRNIRVNAIAPGAIEGRMNRDFVEILQAKAPLTTEQAPIRYRPAPISRWSDPAEIATLAAFLCSDAASYMNGAVYSVDGGLIAL